MHALTWYSPGMFRQKRVYLDAAAGARGNPASPHAEGRAARALLEAARTKIARLTETKADDVLFTSGATEANALAVLGVAIAAREARGSSSLEPRASNPHFLYLPSAHASVVENMRLAAERFGAVVEPLAVHVGRTTSDMGGRVDIEALKKQLRPETVLVSMDAVCGETGVIWNTREVATALANVRPPRSYIMGLLGGPTPKCLLHVDASQAVFTEKLTRSHFGADLLTLDGGKLGVRGVGALVAHRTIPLAPLYAGGGQERGLRSGTENVEAIAAFAAALLAAAEGREKFRAAAERLRAAFLASLNTIPGILINESRAQAPHIVNLSFPGRDTDYLVALLDEAGFAVSTRSACETDSAEGSRAVLALTGDYERAKSTLRISWGSGVQERDLDRFARALAAAVRFIDTGGSE